MTSLSLWRLSPCLLGVCMATAVVSAPHRASAAVKLETRAKPRSVEAGEVFTVEVVVNADEDIQISDAKLPAPNALQVGEPRAMRRSGASIVNGQVQVINGFTLSWSVVANQPGTYRIGPPNLQVNGKRYQGQAVSVEVLPAGSGASAQRRRPGGFPFPMDPLDPFDPLGMFRGQGFPGFPFDNVDPPEPQEPAAPPEYQLDHAPDPTAFLIAKATPRKVVLGQAVRLKIYTYGGAGPYKDGTSNEPSHEGFLSYQVEDSGPPVGVGVRIGERVYVAARIRDMILFPIRTGSQRIGPMRFGFSGRGYRAPQGSPGLMRESAPIDIEVVDPPLAGRPAGYRLGDVGQYTLKASVEPRKVRQGEAVAVIAKLEGTGNLPSKLATPQQTGVDWMEPTVVEKLDTAGGSLHGSRTFTYVVRLDKPGNVDLGELSLAFYDPDKAKYEIAQQDLGSVEVTADPSAPAVNAATSAQEDRLAKLVQPPAQLGEASSRGRYLSDRPGFFGLLLSGPLLVLAGSGVWRALQRSRERWRSRDVAPERRAQRELEAARAAAAQNDLTSTAAALERALHLALEGGTQVRSRGLLRSELGPALQRRGLDRALADNVVELLETTENARFVRSEGGAAASELFARGEGVVNRLLRGGRA